MLEFGTQRDGVGKLAGFHPSHDRLVDAAMHRIDEMLRHQEFSDPLVGLVVGQQRAQQRLFGRRIGRRQTLRQAEQAGFADGFLERFDLVHAAMISGGGMNPSSSSHPVMMW